MDTGAVEKGNKRQVERYGRHGNEKGKGEDRKIPGKGGRQLRRQST
jgi:hypothetical protein